MRAGVAPGPEDITDVVLDNGLRVLLLENPASPSVVIDGVVLAGSTLEPEDRPGLAAFMADMLERGTEDHDFTALSDTLESLGADIGFSAGRHTLSLAAKCLPEDMATIVSLLSEMLTRPSFLPAEVEKLRGQIITGLRQRRDDTRYRAARRFRRLAYGRHHPYGRDADGTPETIGAIQRDELVAFYRRHLHPGGGIVAVVGAFDAGEVEATLRGTLGAWQPGSEAPDPIDIEAGPLPQAQVRDKVAMPGKVQSDVVIGNPAIPRHHPDWMAASVANVVLGVFGLMGRLGRNVRDARGLAYYAYSRLSGGLGPGPWYATAGVRPERVDEAVDAVMLEMKRLGTEAVPGEELGDTVAFMTGSLPLRLETNEGMARALADVALHGLGLDYLQRYGDMIRSVSAADVMAAAARHLHPDRATIVVAGPPADQAP